MKVGINGFGRIGKSIYKLLIEAKIEVPLVNDPFIDLGYMEYLLKHDTVSKSIDCKIEGDQVVANGIKTKLSNEKDINNIKWVDFGVEYVVEASGVFTTLESCSKHNCKRVILTAPSNDIPMYVYGVNHNNIGNDKVISAASCTTNCLAPLVKLINDEYGVVEGFMSTVHAVTSSQKITDGIGSKRRSARSAMNIIPASTGATNAVIKVLPELEGKLSGMAFRVPVLDVSVVDLVVKLAKDTNIGEIKELIKKSSNSVLGYTEDEIVSSDMLGNSHSSIVDLNASMELNSKFYKLISWYDNEYGYSCRVVDILRFIENMK